MAHSFCHICEKFKKSFTLNITSKVHNFWFFIDALSKDCMLTALHLLHLLADSPCMAPRFTIQECAQCACWFSETKSITAVQWHLKKGRDHCIAPSHKSILLQRVIDKSLQ